MTPRTASLTLSLALALACERPAPEGASAPPTQVTLLEFEAEADPAAGRLTISPVAARGLSPVPVVQDGAPDSGPAGTVELVTTAVGEGPAACGGLADSFCGTVRVRSFFAAHEVRDLFVEITAILPASGHEALNSIDPVPPAAAGLSNALGLFDYPHLAPSGAAERLWIFGNPSGAPFRFRGRVMANVGRLALTRVFSGDGSLSSLTHATPGPDGRLYVVLQSGRVRVASDETQATTALWMDLSDRVLFSGAMGLLSIAFDRDFASSPFVYVYYLRNPAGPVAQQSVLSRIPVDPTTMIPNPAAEDILLTVDQENTFHHGGQVAFGPDSHLYLAFGDGGPQGDPNLNAQDRLDLRGKMVRLDVHAFPNVVPLDNPFVGDPNTRPEIWAIGFRNPWRFSFDGAGRLWLADVGQARREEIDHVTRGGNYGWSVMEGSTCFRPSSNCPTAGLTLPVFEYGRGNGDQSITGGFVYDGVIPGFAGAYLFGDFISGRIWRLDLVGGTYRRTELFDTTLSISSFSLTPAGELLVLHYPGQIFRLDFIPYPG